jgi:hypothetical protein
MGVDPSGKGGDADFKWPTWRVLLTLAYYYGWKPAGTEQGWWVHPETGELINQMSPDPDDWDGDYFTNAFQWVTDEDANSADPLGRACNEEDDKEFNIDFLCEFITYCRAGAFSIA